MKHPIKLVVAIGVTISCLTWAYFYTRPTLKPKSTNPVYISPVQTQPITKQEPSLKRYFSKLGIKNKSINLVYGDSPALTGEDASYYNNTITVNPGATEEAKLQMIGHEYMHYYWQTKLTNKQKASLTDDLTYAYNSDPWIPSQLAKPLYADCDDECKIQEKYAYACTSLFDYSLTQQLINHCNEVLPGRHLITW